jgi:hypothetical protein
MTIKVGNYFIGQNINEVSGVKEFTLEDYKNNPIRRVFKNESLYYGAPIVFGNCQWDMVTIGVINDKIYKIGLNLSGLSDSVSKDIVESLTKLFSTETGQEPQKSFGQIVWYLDSSEICLAKRGLFGLNIINLIFTSTNIFKEKSRTETVVLLFKHGLDYLKTIWKRVF